MSNGMYTGVAPEADMYLIETGSLRTAEEVEKNVGSALDRGARFYSNSKLFVLQEF
ncbi:hypothetical protein [Paenibacillus sp. FSL A5-0031]|uniref:hypothetical protein n=1 Tax=Paenibacillus sp. FSL A5-0031 TaxID=1920420 RepID=UPI0015C2EBC4|nr:hypothetical protein [Paenibacillus sp. FSL A5-0031]